MLNFDDSHKSFDGNINLIKAKRLFRKVLATGLIVAQLFTFTACSKTVDCDIETNHAHYYVSEEDIGRYIVSEKESVSNLERTDKYIDIDEEAKEVLEFMNKKDLFRRDDNSEALAKIQEKNQDYTEYRYKYVFLQPIPVAIPNGKSVIVTYHYAPVTKYSWTTDTSRNLTGEERVCHYVYYGYKLVEENNKLTLVQSDYYDNIADIPSEYEYISESYYKIVNSETKEEVNYEDGKEDDLGDEEINKMIDELEQDGKIKEETKEY